MSNSPLHHAQLHILQTLRHIDAARFSDLMRPTGLQSDAFKFHIRALVKQGYIEKTGDQYVLTAAGKEFANNLDDGRRTVQRQPKLSVLVIARQGDEPIYLFQQRQRKPYLDYWSCIGGPIGWGEAAEEAARREFEKQTGLTADYAVRGFYRKRDYDAGSRELLEDKLFVIIEATNLAGELSNDWPWGINQWMTVEAFEQQPKYFTSVCEAIDMIQTGKSYASEEAFNPVGDY